MRDRPFKHQNYRASGLNLLVAAIILWDTACLERAIDALKNKGTPVSVGLIAHFSPLAWINVRADGGCPASERAYGLVAHEHGNDRVVPHYLLHHADDGDDHPDHAYVDDDA